MLHELEDAHVYILNTLVQFPRFSPWTFVKTIQHQRDEMFVSHVGYTTISKENSCMERKRFYSAFLSSFHKKPLQCTALIETSSNKLTGIGIVFIFSFPPFSSSWHAKKCYLLSSSLYGTIWIITRHRKTFS